MFFELQEHRNTTFAASEVARCRAKNVLWASRAQEHNFCSIWSAR
jgi:hypothetical protein